jgi:L-cysteine/cystine lyase
VDLRAAFPVFEHTAYLNAGTCGPLPLAARTALEQVYDLGERDGRRQAYYERLFALRTRQRDAYTALLGAQTADVALTTATSEGVARVVAGLGLGRGDEVLTSDAEHQGLLGPLLAAGIRRGVEIRTVPLAELPGALSPRTKLVACSHVGWVTGDLAPDLSGLPEDVPLLLDGAQGIGAVPVDVRALGCAFYAGSGQKWLCGPVGTGMLYIAPQWRERLDVVGPSYVGYEDPYRPLDPDALHADARLHDAPSIPPESVAAADATLDLLSGFGWDAIHTRAHALAASLADRLAERGKAVGPRGATTLVAWEEDDPAGRRRADGRRRRRRARDPEDAVRPRRRSARGTTRATSTGCSPRSDQGSAALPGAGHVELVAHRGRQLAADDVGDRDVLEHLAQAHAQRDPHLAQRLGRAGELHGLR